MQAANTQKKMDELLAGLEARGERKKLLLHACCAPCSSYVLEYLSRYFAITVFYYNPNITEAGEYAHREEEEKRLIREMPLSYPVEFLSGDYEPERFLQEVQGLEGKPEGGERCAVCFRLRLSACAKAAKENGFDCFATTLTISPLKNAALINAIGEEAAETYGVPYLASDFKKNGGYQRSIELSREYDLYRQNYCGCVFSREGRA